MPIYEYLCQSCQKPFERLVRSLSDERAAACPVCGAKDVERQFSVIAAPRSGGSKPLPVGSTGGCGRCGDPNGPCGID